MTDSPVLQQDHQPTTTDPIVPDRGLDRGVAVPSPPRHVTPLRCVLPTAPHRRCILAHARRTRAAPKSTALYPVTP